MSHRYYHITVSINSPHKPPYYTGSMLRGALGYALKRVTCINPSYHCEGCFAQSSCLYYDFYERENIQHKFRLDIELDSKRYDFGLYLFGDACEKLPYILSSLQLALAENGIGKNRDKFTDITIDVNQERVYSHGSFTNSLNITPNTLEIPEHQSNLKIHLLTPLRIKKANTIELKDISIENILRSIHQRSSQIFADQTIHRLDFTPTYTTTIKALNHKLLYRKSNRQGRKINIDGVIGEIAVLGLDEQSYTLLKLGELIGVGKQTVFGLGKIKVEEIDNK